VIDGADPQRLMARGVPWCRDAHHRAIAEHVVLTIDETDVLPGVEVDREVPARPFAVCGLPFGSLDDDRDVAEKFVAAAVVEVEMGADGQIDPIGERRDAFVDRAPLGEVGREDVGEAA